MPAYSGRFPFIFAGKRIDWGPELEPQPKFLRGNRCNKTKKRKNKINNIASRKNGYGGIDNGRRALSSA